MHEFEARLDAIPTPRGAGQSGTDGDDAAMPSAYNVVQFMRNYPELCAAAERLCAQPLPNIGDAASLLPEDLPRETAQIRMAMNAAPEIQSAFRVKDEVIWQLTQACVLRRAAPAYYPLALVAFLVNVSSPHRPFPPHSSFLLFALFSSPLHRTNQ